ncbi:MAG: L,D-transpeptidase family protein [Desulfosalsimonadaceae bacterium]
MAKASEGFITSGYHCNFPVNRMICAVLCMMLATGAVALRPCHAEGSMDALTAAMSEYLVCCPLELITIEKQQLAGISQKVCLAAVYNPTALCPFWVAPEGPGPKASIVLDFLKKAETEGLDPKNYEVDRISALFAAPPQPRSLAELDTLLTFNLIKYIHDAGRGRIKPHYADPSLFTEASGVNFDPQAVMEKALQEPDLAVYLEGLPPAHQHYVNLKKALMTYRAIEKSGGWLPVAAGKTIRPGDQDERIPAVIRRLMVTGDLDTKTAEETHYSPLLKQGIMKFQARHGLAPDGVIGPNTLAAMNVPVSDRIKQIIINMTRWRWQAHDLGEKYILINIANFDLTAFENGQEVFNFPVIVGKSQYQTPIFSDRIMDITLNPYWTVPPSIARNEELPKLKKDPNHLVKQHIRLFSGWNEDAGEIDSRFVDWKHVSPAIMGQYKLRQDPGEWNALGQIKFESPNEYDVFLHDTPTRNLFSQIHRALSHGCIRLSDPLKLAAFALSRQAGAWTPEKISSSMKEKKLTGIRLTEPLPVHITYRTSWVDKDGLICFNSDIYGQDKKLFNALFNK